MQKITSRKVKLKKHMEYFKNSEPCGKCMFHCPDNSISCLVCSKLFHNKCLNLSKKARNELKRTVLGMF